MQAVQQFHTMEIVEIVLKTASRQSLFLHANLRLANPPENVLFAQLQSKRRKKY